MGKNTKIDWCDASWNPVVGCYNNCPYCYARRIAERFTGYDRNDSLNEYKYAVIGYKGSKLYEVDTSITRKTKDGETQSAPYPFGFAPTMFNYKLTELRTWKEPKNIFVCSMADLFAEWIPDGWIQSVFTACERYPQHRYFFLTKNPHRYYALRYADKLPKKDNFWYGTTATNQHQCYFAAFGYNCYLSIEPIQEYLNVGLGSLGSLKWIIVGAETGNRVGKVKPQREWIDNVVDAANITQTPVFMKDSLQTLMGDDFRQEYPWE